MPALRPHLLNCAIYLYTSDAHARAGTRAGGSGFLVSVPSTVDPWVHLYAVTNKHVLDAGGRVVRLNDQSGGVEIVTTTADQWTVALDDDLAVLPLTLRPSVQWWAIPVAEFMTKDLKSRMTGLPIGAGDEVALIGRLIGHDGTQRNKPVVRFGNISMDADETAKVRFGNQDQEAFLVECRSLAGFSGSAVLVYPSSHRAGFTIMGQIGPWLLGIDCGHLPTWMPVCDAKDLRTARGDAWVETNSGIAVVIPAWRLAALLNDADLAQQRRNDDTELARTNPATDLGDIEVKSASGVTVLTPDEVEQNLKRQS